MKFTTSSCVCIWITLVAGVIIVDSGVTAFTIPTASKTLRLNTRSATATASTSLHASTTKECDILVLGSGPAGLAISSLLAEKDLKVVLADANYDREFAPNYDI